MAARTVCVPPAHSYTTMPGVYTVTLTVSGLGGTDTETKANYITVYAPVQANFSATPTNGVAPLAVTFTNLSTGDYATCTWVFGDGGTTAACADPAHSYTTPGVYTVTLTVSGLGRATDTRRNRLHHRLHTGAGGLQRRAHQRRCPAWCDFHQPIHRRLRDVAQPRLR